MRTRGVPFSNGIEIEIKKRKLRRKEGRRGGVTQQKKKKEKERRTQKERRRRGPVTSSCPPLCSKATLSQPSFSSSTKDIIILFNYSTPFMVNLTNPDNWLDNKTCNKNIEFVPPSFFGGAHHSSGSPTLAFDQIAVQVSQQSNRDFGLVN